MPGRPIRPDEQRSALGDPSRLGDWLDHFRHELSEAGWDEVLVRWWPRLLPGIAAGATHGVIRTGHAVAALRDGVTGPRTAELADALGYWAARWQPVPDLVLAGPLGADAAVGRVPRVPRQDGGIEHRLAQLGDVPGWADEVGALAGPSSEPDASRLLADIVAAVVRAYPRMAVGQPTMLVHAATAPNAVRRVLPSLPPGEHVTAVRTAWSATAAVLAAYAPDPRVLASGGARSTGAGPTTSDGAWELALADGSEHVLKLADTALDVVDAVGEETVARAVAVAVALEA